MATRTATEKGGRTGEDIMRNEERWQRWRAKAMNNVIMEDWGLDMLALLLTQTSFP